MKEKEKLPEHLRVLARVTRRLANSTNAARQQAREIEITGTVIEIAFQRGMCVALAIAARSVGRTYVRELRDWRESQ